jgi:bifunctional UDP-N-acetylglucosamine pyrophosphorylase/glucosamine-1-phosphate N-acetyltransferase
VKQSLAKRPAQFVTQEQQLGTGHALLQTRPLLEGKAGTVVCCRATRRCSPSIREGAARHAPEAAAATVITANLPRPFGYGRIVRRTGSISKIVEERDASPRRRRSPKSIPASTPSTSPRCLRARSHRHREQAGRVLPARSRRDLSQAETRGRDVDRRRADEIRGINSRTELAEVSTWSANRRTKS